MGVLNPGPLKVAVRRPERRVKGDTRNKGRENSGGARCCHEWLGICYLVILIMQEDHVTAWPGLYFYVKEWLICFHDINPWLAQKKFGGPCT